MLLKDGKVKNGEKFSLLSRSIDQLKEMKNYTKGYDRYKKVNK